MRKKEWIEIYIYNLYIERYKEKKPPPLLPIHVHKAFKYGRPWRIELPPAGC
jgi:hypothetical protein